MIDEARSTSSTVDRPVVYSSQHEVRLPHRPPRNSKSCLSQPAWTTTPKRTGQNLIIRSGKSEAEVTNNRRLRSSYCTAGAIYRHTRSIARPLCDSRATCCGGWLLECYRWCTIKMVVSNSCIRLCAQFHKKKICSA